MSFPNLENMSLDTNNASFHLPTANATAKPRQPRRRNPPKTSGATHQRNKSKPKKAVPTDQVDDDAHQMKLPNLLTQEQKKLAPKKPRKKGAIKGSTSLGLAVAPSMSLLSSSSSSSSLSSLSSSSFGLSTERDKNARIFLRSLEPRVRHLGNISYRVVKLHDMSNPLYNSYLTTTTNISLKSLASIVMTRSSIMTLSGEAQRTEQHRHNAQYRLEHYPMQPVTGDLERSHRALSIRAAVKIGDDNVYFLMRMYGDQCIYDTFVFLDQVISARLMDKSEVIRHAETICNFDEMDLTSLEGVE